jgi:hypothetical protein
MFLDLYCWQMKKPTKIPGSNKYDIDPEQVEMLAARFWTNVEIASFFGIDEGTIRKGFSDILTKGRAIGKGKLRDLQWSAAEKGNTAILIWLGKQYLGQTEKVETVDNELLSNELVFPCLQDKDTEKYKKYIS